MSDSHWLLIFDNADDLDILQHAWPQDPSSEGCILLTSRDSAGASSLVSGSFHVQPFDVKTGSEAFLSIAGLDLGSELNMQYASTISSTFGGLPLALGQMGAFIARSRVPLRDFLPLYDRNSTTIDARNTMEMYYSHTLADVWDQSLTKLSENAQMLLRVLAFMYPDNIHESLLEDRLSQPESPILQIITDELE